MIQPDGKPVDLDAYLLGLKPGNSAHSSSGVRWQDERVIAHGDGWISWWRKAGPATVFVCRQKKAAQKLRVWIPPMLFACGPRNKVWLLGKNERPTHNSTLYLPGWANTYNDGGVCWGNGRRPGNLSPTDWEDAFFASSFYTKANFRTQPYATKKHHKAYGKLGAALEALARKTD